LLSAADRLVRSSQHRIVTVRPRSRDEFREMVIDPSRGVMLVPTLEIPADNERVLLDVRLPDATDGLVLRTRATYTFPERKGPFFACRRDDLVRLHDFLDHERRFARAFKRYPALIQATVRGRTSRMRGQILDLSMVAARIAVLGDLEHGEPVSIELVRAPSLLPPKLTGTVTALKGGVVTVRFGGPAVDAWRRLRRVLRRADETGLMPRLS
jgi:hypothetical protein